MFWSTFSPDESRVVAAARGVMTLLEKTGMEVKGKDAVVVGASNIVGRPMALELLLAELQQEKETENEKGQRGLKEKRKKEK
mgnify:CR=1 FL=1